MNNYLVYKISGGLNHMLNEINYCIVLAQRTNRKLIIDTNSSAFSNDFNKYFEIPNLEYYTNFDIIKNDKSIDLSKYHNFISGTTKYDKGDYKLNGQSIYLTEEQIMKSKERILFFTKLKNFLSGVILYRKEKFHIKVRKNIMDEIKSVSKIDGEYVGLHFRNTDMKSDLTSLVKDMSNHLGKIKKIYFATDDYSSFDKLKKMVPFNVEIYRNTIPFNNGGKNIHYGNPNKDEVIMNALIDMYFLKNSTVFIPCNQSSFSKRIIFLRKRGGFFD